MKKIIIALLLSLLLVTTTFGVSEYENCEGKTGFENYENLSKKIYDKVLVLGDKLIEKYSMYNDSLIKIKTDLILEKLSILKSERKLTDAQTEIVDLLGYRLACSIYLSDTSDNTGTTSTGTTSTGIHNEQTNSGPARIGEKAFNDNFVGVTNENVNDKIIEMSGYKSVDGELLFRGKCNPNINGMPITQEIMNNNIIGNNGGACHINPIPVRLGDSPLVITDSNGNDGKFNWTCNSIRYPSTPVYPVEHCFALKLIEGECGGEARTCDSGEIKNIIKNKYNVDLQDRNNSNKRNCGSTNCISQNTWYCKGTISGVEEPNTNGEYCELPVQVPDNYTAPLPDNIIIISDEEQQIRDNIKDLYTTILGKEPDASGLTRNTNQVLDGHKTFGDVENDLIYARDN